MVRKLAFASCVVFALAVAAPASAQLCTGQPSFAVAPMQVTPSAAFADGASEFGGTFTRGSERLFAGAGLFRSSYSDVEESAVAVSGGVGADFAADTANRLHVCPVGMVSWQNGPNSGDLDVRTLTFGGGGQVGYVASDNGRLAIVPTAGVTIHRARVNVSFLGVDESASETFGLIHAGVGLVFNNQRMSLNPMLSFPVGLEGENDVQFSVGFSVNFGSR